MTAGEDCSGLSTFNISPLRFHDPLAFHLGVELMRWFCPGPECLYGIWCASTAVALSPVHHSLVERHFHGASSRRTKPGKHQHNLDRPNDEAAVTFIPDSAPTAAPAMAHPRR